jgi:hypothetical protein
VTIRRRLNERISQKKATAREPKISAKTVGFVRRERQRTREKERERARVKYLE